MASIKIISSQKNLIFAALVSNETGAEFREEEQWIIIEDSPELTIPQYCFTQAFDPNGTRQADSTGRLESAWRSLLLNKRGYLKRFDDFEIVITDDPPKEAAKRPPFLYRFESTEVKAEAETLADRLNLTLTDFIADAIAHRIQFWKGQIE